MKNIIIHNRGFYLKMVLILSIMVCSLTSCKKFLEKSIDSRTLIDQLKDMEKAVVAIEPTSDYLFTSLLSDEYEFKDISGHVQREVFSKMKPIFEFSILKQSISKNEMLASGFNPNIAFLRYYFRINNAYFLINNATKYVPQNEVERVRIKNVIAQCMVIKGYCHFMLVNLFGKQYNASTAATDLAVPYIEAYSSKAVETRNRASVKLIYDEVEKDWLTALDMMDDERRELSGKFYFNKRALQGLLSRLYLNKKDWDNAIKFADAALLIDKIPLNVKAVRAGTTDPDEYSRRYFDPANSSYLMMGNNTYQLIAYFWSGFYPYPMQRFLGANGADASNNHFIQTSALFVDLIPQKWLYFYPTTRRNMNMPLITIDEILFNRAEAHIEKNQGANDAAKADLNHLLDYQSLSAMALTANKTAVQALSGRQAAIDLLLKIKLIRFYIEGTRWFDIRRHQLPVVHTTSAGTFKLSGNPEEYVIKVPLEEIQFNSEIDK